MPTGWSPGSMYMTTLWQVWPHQEHKSRNRTPWPIGIGSNTGWGEGLLFLACASSCIKETFIWGGELINIFQYRHKRKRGTEKKSVNVGLLRTSHRNETNFIFLIRECTYKSIYFLKVKHYFKSKIIITHFLFLREVLLCNPSWPQTYNCPDLFSLIQN